MSCCESCDRRSVESYSKQLHKSADVEQPNNESNDDGQPNYESAYVDPLKNKSADVEPEVQTAICKCFLQSLKEALHVF